MTSLLGRYSTRIWIVALAISICGCTVGGKSMSLDSTSRMPWFGLELKERKRKSEGPDFRAVRLDKGKSKIEAASDRISGETASLPKKASTALPMTDQSMAVDSTGSDSGEFDFR